MRTKLTSDITDADTTINVEDASGFPSSGKIRVGDEIITYTGTTATSFTGCSRGTYGSFASAHSKGEPVSTLMIYFEKKVSKHGINYYDSINFASDPQDLIVDLTFETIRISYGSTKTLNGIAFPRTKGVWTTERPFVFELDFKRIKKSIVVTANLTGDNAAIKKKQLMALEEAGGSMDAYLYDEKMGYVQLTGTISLSSGSKDVSGTSTLFTSELSVGDHIGVEGSSNIYQVASISSDTALTISESAKSDESGNYGWYRNPVNITNLVFEYVDDQASFSNIRATITITSAIDF